MTEFENENGLPSDMGDEILDTDNDLSAADESGFVEDSGDRAADGDIGAVNDREEYERLIKTTYKEFFTEDTQKLINRRFKKYKAIEERVKFLENEAQKYADIERMIATERERAVMETEERMNREFRAMILRPEENAVGRRSLRSSPDISALTKSERASLASRALMGEKIKL